MAFRTLKNIEMLTKSPRRIKKRNKCILYVFRIGAKREIKMSFPIKKYARPESFRYSM